MLQIIGFNWIWATLVQTISWWPAAMVSCNPYYKLNHISNNIVVTYANVVLKLGIESMFLLIVNLLIGFVNDWVTFNQVHHQFNQVVLKPQIEMLSCWPDLGSETDAQESVIIKKKDLSINNREKQYTYWRQF